MSFRFGSRFTAAALLAAAVCACGGGLTPTAPADHAGLLLQDFFLAPPLKSNGSILLCQRFEVTRREYLADDSGDAELPAVLMNHLEALAWAQAHGLRLPTAQEWLHLSSIGEGAIASPASLAPVGSRNTLELGLGRVLPVGVFEKGRTPLGGYDFFGNVWEWTNSSDSNDLAIACGGSFASWSVGTDWLEQRRLEPQESASDLGFRCVADAAPYLMRDWQRHASLTPALAQEFRDSILLWKPTLRQRLATELQRLEAPPEWVALLKIPSGLNEASP
ncbi:MAG: SUMF1/EgtB/PvdO family nonheme iron enzyme [Planctomycetes bacterium]|nr:SUMF1/EgtB/PvdO family nonheme iron enzyme [Planctomycetota bacterium]MBT4028826.1 SUMF1/EgtB/PvdO family nonheme iron enzyme [Planctomycetota bacterium]MBT4559614.1 SUMF1/EgtB/PvdO family nonheme iron enzyme [Planctomycetota bacterium]MBT5100552.1 SUMF1/EgtB/PvdO family nonheme iron enzyme [Planctomycetota bacterium]MBT5120112.1 SUMF1/EgtB/PvdO family nonheme iron enzyme [Planctomycetota bacterium]